MNIAEELKFLKGLKHKVLFSAAPAAPSPYPSFFQEIKQHHKPGDCFFYISKKELPKGYHKGSFQMIVNPGRYFYSTRSKAKAKQMAFALFKPTKGMEFIFAPTVGMMGFKQAGEPGHASYQGVSVNTIPVTISCTVMGPEP